MVSGAYYRAERLKRLVTFVYVLIKKQKTQKTGLHTKLLLTYDLTSSVFQLA